jgi:pilus assembly protein TadC
MRTLRTAVAALLVVGLATSAFAGDLEKSIAKAAQQEETRSQKNGGSKALVAAGSGLFVGGMAMGLYAFMNNKNGEFAEFGEANAVNKKLGAIGVGAAFAGGMLMFLGHNRAKHAPSITVGPGQVSVSKQLSW